MELSIIIPSYNEQNLIEKTIKETRNYFLKLYEKDEFEIIIVNDGSKDNTEDIVKKIKKESNYNNLKLLSYNKNKGKGYAVKRGMHVSKGEINLMMDADLATPLNQFEKIIKFIDNYDIVIGSRVSPKAERKPLKEILGKTSYFIVESILHLNLKDTQCGFKLFRKDVLDIFEEQTIDGFGFDFEILYIARKKGYKIKEIPVKWKEKGDSKVKLKHYFLALNQLLEVKKNH